MTKETVKELVTEHRDRVWIDPQGELWFYHGFDQKWLTLCSLYYNNSRESEGFIPLDLELEDQHTAGPFTAVATAVYYEEERE